MGKYSGERARRKLAVASRNHPGRYEQISAARDKARLVTALRSIANRLEAELVGERVKLGRVVPVAEGALAVTDHAVLRFLERAMGLNIPAIRQEIARLVPRNSMPSAHANAHDILQRDGLQFLITPTSVISVLSEGMVCDGWLQRDELEILDEALA